MSRAGLLIHGRGRPAEEMREIAARIGAEDIRWAAPRAPSGQWYPHRFTAPVASNEPSLSGAISQCDAALRGVAQDVPAAQTIVLGFSQGACLASEYVLRHPDRCRTLIMFTGGLIGDEERDWQPAGGASLHGVRVLITGSDADEWVTEARVRLTADVFTRLGATVDLRICPGRGHVVSDDEIARARALIETLPR